MVSRFRSVRGFSWVFPLVASGPGEFRVPNLGLQAQSVSQKNFNATASS